MPPNSDDAGGGRSRAGNAMARTRRAVLEGALRCVEKHGLARTTMSEVAATAGVAKATLYNHFRTRDELLAALLEHEVALLADEAEATATREGAAAALTLVADRLGTSAALRRVAETDPAVLGRTLSGPAQESPAGRLTAATLAQVLSPLVTPEQLPAATEVALRWLLTQLSWPGSALVDGYGAEVLVAGFASLSSRAEVPAPRPEEG